MPVPAGPNMGGPSTVDKRKLRIRLSIPLPRIWLTFFPAVKMGAMMGGSMH